MSSSKISTLLDDSDDSVFQSPILKRKVHPPSLPAKRPKTTKLSQSLLSQVLSQKKKPDTQEALKTESKELFTCPLCKKSFKNSILGISHLKQCGKKRKVPLDDLQRALKGNYSVKPGKKAAAESIETQNNLSLATAISLSITTTIAPEVDKRVFESQKATLETFGFTSTSTASTSRRRKKGNRVSVLRLRSEDDRRKLISEKCAAILLDMDEDNVSNSLGEKAVPDVHPVPKLWVMTSGETPTCYVPELRDHIAPNVEASTSKNAKNPKIATPLASSQQPCLNQLSSDWGKMVGNTKFSDAAITTLDGFIPIHKIVLAVRCPYLDIDSFITCKLRITSAAFLSILKYIYTGQLGRIEKTMINECVLIANKMLQMGDLVDLLNQITTASSDDTNMDEADTVPVFESLTPQFSDVSDEECLQTEPNAKEGSNDSSDYEVITLSDDEPDLFLTSPSSQSLLSSSYQPRKDDDSGTSDGVSPEKKPNFAVSSTQGENMQH